VEVLGKTDFDIYPPEQAAAFHADDQQVLDGQPVFNREETLTRPDGSVLWLLTSKVPLFDATGKVTGLAGFGLDITKRKQTEETIIRLAMAVEQAAETIVITNADGTIVYVNPAFEKATGYTRAEALGQNPRILKSGKQDPEFYRRMWEVLKRGEAWRGHMINKRKDGTLYEEEATISPVRDATGEIVNYVAAKRDVTREVQLDAQLRQSQKMEAIGQLAGGVAHDFNNILAIIQMQAGLLKNGGNLSAAQLEMAEEIGNTVDRAAALTRQLLLFSRQEIIQPQDVDLNISIADMTKILRRSLGETIQVQLKLTAQPMFIHADAGMINQVLLNLAVNARDAMLNGGHLVIETSGVEFDELSVAQSPSARLGSFVCLSVGDTGCGIPPDILPKIFEPFFTTKGVGKGTGLGLATVFGIAQQHKGWVNVYSEVGHGTTFKIYLPRLVGMSDKKIAQKMLATVPAGKEAILLVEDETVLRNSFQKALASLGYHILEAPTGVKALEVWREHRDEIHLLLTDLVMPDGMTGKELAQWLLGENPKLKVIYMSGYSAELADHDLSLQEGINFLAKPFQMQRLAQAVRQKLDQPDVPPPGTALKTQGLTNLSEGTNPPGN
jgi:PAS domain S-box-containing protein